jgi:hypothetical protein
MTDPVVRAGRCLPVVLIGLGKGGRCLGELELEEVADPAERDQLLGQVFLSPG